MLTSKLPSEAHLPTRDNKWPLDKLLVQWQAKPRATALTHCHHRGEARAAPGWQVASITSFVVSRPQKWPIMIHDGRSRATKADTETDAGTGVQIEAEPEAGAPKRLNMSSDLEMTNQSSDR